MSQKTIKKGKFEAGEICGYIFGYPGPDISIIKIVNIDYQAGTFDAIQKYFDWNLLNGKISNLVRSVHITDKERNWTRENLKNPRR